MISYTSIVNQLSSSLCKSKEEQSTHSSEALPIFLFKFNIKTLSLLGHSAIHNKQIVVSIKFLNYPMFKIPIKTTANNTNNKAKITIEINQSFSLYFKFNPKELEDRLKKVPLVIVVVDSVSHKIIASARIHLNVFAKKAFLAFNPSCNPIPNPRRKTIFLFHLSDLNKPIGDIDIAMIIRREYFKEHSEADCISNSNKEKCIFIAQPYVSNEAHNHFDYSSNVSFAYHQMSKFECEKDESFSNGSNYGNHSIQWNDLGIFTGAKFPNPNAIFFSNKATTKPIESKHDNNACSTESDFNRKDVNDNDKEKVMLIKKPQKKITVSYKSIPKTNFAIANNQNKIVNYDHFIKQSFLNSMNDYNKTFIKAKDNIKMIKKENRDNGLYKCKSTEKIDYYKG